MTSAFQMICAPPIIVSKLIFNHVKGILKRFVFYSNKTLSNGRYKARIKD